jgi:hypothetical protein
MRELFGQFPMILAAATALTLLGTVCHEWGYFAVVGPSFQTFMTTWDYFANATVWGFPLLIITGFLVITNMYTWRADNFQPKGFSSTSTKWHRRVLVNWQFELYFLGIMALSFFTKPTASWFRLLAALLVFQTIIYFFRHPSFEKAITLDQATVVALIPTVAIVLYDIGRSDADEDLATDNSPYVLRLKNDYTGYRVTILRVSDKGILVHDPDTRTTSFHHSEDVRDVLKVQSMPDKRPLSCQWVGWRCPPR